MKKEHEVTPLVYASKYSTPLKTRREFAVELDGTTVYADWFELYLPNECKIGWLQGEWTRIQLSRIGGICALS